MSKACSIIIIIIIIIIISSSSSSSSSNSIIFGVMANGIGILARGLALEILIAIARYFTVILAVFYDYLKHYYGDNF